MLKYFEPNEKTIIVYGAGIQANTTLKGNSEPGMHVFKKKNRPKPVF